MKKRVLCRGKDIVCGCNNQVQGDKVILLPGADDELLAYASFKLPKPIGFNRGWLYFSIKQHKDHPLRYRVAIFDHYDGVWDCQAVRVAPRQPERLWAKHLAGDFVQFMVYIDQYRGYVTANPKPEKPYAVEIVEAWLAENKLAK